MQLVCNSNYDRIIKKTLQNLLQVWQNRMYDNRSQVRDSGCTDQMNHVMDYEMNDLRPRVTKQSYAKTY
jgi:hypothetical protein